MKFKKSKDGQESIRITDTSKKAYLVLVMIFTTLSHNAQTVAQTPQPPTTITRSTSESTHSVVINDDNHFSQNTSVSISISDDSYKFKASYHDSKNNMVKAMLLDYLGEADLIVKRDVYFWGDSKNGRDFFECKLTNGHVKIVVDREMASESFVEKIKTLGNELKYVISGKDSKQEKAEAAERAKEDLKRAERELARAKKELERAEKQIKRTGKN